MESSANLEKERQWWVFLLRSVHPRVVGIHLHPSGTLGPLQLRSNLASCDRFLCFQIVGYCEQFETVIDENRNQRSLKQKLESELS